MKQYEAAIKVMEDNGGFATLGYLYQNVLDVPDVIWKTKTPFASIRRIVQDDRFFFKIKPGLWALKSHKAKVLQNFQIDGSSQKTQKFGHYYFQGLLVEIGNLRKYQTFIPYQDKNKLFLGQPLSQRATLSEFFQFTYPRIVKRAITIDISWFNERNLPHSFFEVEHTTNIQNSLLKFLDLQDFYANFYIVSSSTRKKDFESKLGLSAFNPIKERVKFLDYDYIAQLHSKTFALHKLQKVQPITL